MKTLWSKSMKLIEIRQQLTSPKPKKPRKIWSKSKSTPPRSEQKILAIQWHHIPITIIHSTKAKRFRLSYSPGHEIRVTVPYTMSDAALSILLKQYESWILKHHLSSSDSILSSNPDLSDHSRGHFLTHKQSALEFCTRKVEQWNTKLWWNYQNITVKSLKTKRWSCSSKWNLNFNYKLMFLPEPMADYVIVHELCHLREMNHGPRFWKLVEEVYGPDWRKWRKIR